jgi:purine-binding chemotaxis protein CheW
MSTAVAASSASQVLCFQLAGQEYAVSILQVKEIRRYSPTTTLPDVPPYVLGVINLRGTVIPVFDLRQRFGVGPTTIDRNTAIIVVSVETRNVGLLVDAVTRVENITPEMLRPTPPLAGTVDSSFLSGLIAIGDRLITWLDVAQLLKRDLQAA